MLKINNIFIIYFINENKIFNVNNYNLNLINMFIFTDISIKMKLLLFLMILKFYIILNICMDTKNI